MTFILSALWWIRIRGLWKLPAGRDWLRGKLGLVLMGGARFSKSLIQFSVDGRGCVPSLLFDLRPNYDGGNEDKGDLLQKVPCTSCCACASITVKTQLISKFCVSPSPQHLKPFEMTFASMVCFIPGERAIIWILGYSTQNLPVRMGLKSQSSRHTSRNPHHPEGFLP